MVLRGVEGTKQQRQTSLSLTPSITDGLRALPSYRTGTTCFVAFLFSLLHTDLLGKWARQTM